MFCAVGLSPGGGRIAGRLPGRSIDFQVGQLTTIQTVKTAHGP